MGTIPHWTDDLTEMAGLWSKLPLDTRDARVAPAVRCRVGTALVIVGGPCGQVLSRHSPGHPHVPYSRMSTRHGPTIGCHGDTALVCMALW